MVAADDLMALTSLAGQAIVAAAVTDVWESARRKVAALLSRGDARQAETVGRQLDRTRQLMTAAASADLQLVRAHQVSRWAARVADLLDEDPDIETELRSMINDIQAQLLAVVVSAVSHGVAAGRDVRIRGSGSSVVAGVIDGNVEPVPTNPGPAS